jgi:hypothetical protein
LSFSSISDLDAPSLEECYLGCTEWHNRLATRLQLVIKDLIHTNKYGYQKQNHSCLLSMGIWVVLQLKFLLKYIIMNIDYSLYGLRKL